MSFVETVSGVPTRQLLGRQGLPQSGREALGFTVSMIVANVRSR